MEILSLIVKHESRFINLEEKIDLQISGFAFPKRAPSSWKKNYFEKQLFQWKLFKINGSQNILNFGEFMVPKILFHNKIISKKLLTTMAYMFWTPSH